MDSNEQLISIIKEHIAKNKVTEYVERSDEFEVGLLIGLEAMYQYVKDNYQCIKKRKIGRKKCQKIRKGSGKRKKISRKK